MYTHPFRWSAFIAAIAFTLVLIGWLTITTNVLSFAQVSIVGPVLLIAAGLAGVGATLRRKK